MKFSHGPEAFGRSEEQYIVRTVIGDDDTAKAFIRFLKTMPSVHRSWKDGLDSTTFHFVVAVRMLPERDLNTNTARMQRLNVYKTLFLAQRAQTYDAFKNLNEQPPE
jgi:hypothetical protein